MERKRVGERYTEVDKKLGRKRVTEMERRL